MIQPVVHRRIVVDAPQDKAFAVFTERLDRHGPGWESLGDGLATGDGWPLYLDRLARLL